MRKPKLSADTALLSMIKAGMVLKITGMKDSPIVRRSSMYKQIVAERPAKLQTKRCPMTKKGLTDALNWAGEGYVGYHFDVVKSEA